MQWRSHCTLLISCRSSSCLLMLYSVLCLIHFALAVHSSSSVPSPCRETVTVDCPPLVSRHTLNSSTAKILTLSCSARLYLYSGYFYYCSSHCVEQRSVHSVYLCSLVILHSHRVRLESLMCYTLLYIVLTATDCPILS